MSGAEVRDLRTQTFEFLATYSDAAQNREVAGHLKYLQALACQPNWAFRQIQRILGAFVKPKRILFLICLAIIFFGGIFTLPVFRFSLSGSDGDVERSLSVLEALYFSGISFTTIGYGDIAPLGWARVCAVLEGLLGIVLASSLLVSFIRKYLD
jgi:hypothetical protein